MQPGWGDGCDLGVCKAGSNEDQDREGNHARGGKDVCETRRSKKHELCELPLVFGQIMIDIQRTYPRQRPGSENRPAQFGARTGVESVRPARFPESCLRSA